MTEALEAQPLILFIALIFFHVFLKECDWPVEGLLDTNSSPMKRMASKTPDLLVPMQLRVLRNGEKKNIRPLVIGPDISPGWKSQ